MIGEGNTGRREVEADAAEAAGAGQAKAAADAGRTEEADDRPGMKLEDEEERGVAGEAAEGCEDDDDDEEEEEVAAVLER